MDLTAISIKFVYTLKPMKKKILTWLLLLLCISGSGQIYRGIHELKPYYGDLKELESVLRSNPRLYWEESRSFHERAKEDQNLHLECIMLIYDASSHYYKNQIDSAKHYFEEAVVLGDQLGNDQLSTTASIRLIFCDENEKSAMELTRLMSGEFETSYNNQDTINMIYSLNGLAQFYDRMDSTEKALKMYYNGLYLSEKSHNRPQEGFILNNLGLMKMDLGAHDSAYADYQRGLIIAQETKDLRLECHLRENIAMYYLRKDSAHLAEKEYEYVLNIGNEHGFVDMQIVSIINMSNLERTRGNLEKSDSLYTLGLKRAKEEKLLEHVSIIYVGRASLYNMMGRYEDAIIQLDSSLLYAEFFSIADVQLIYHQFKSRLYEKMGEDKQALEHYKIYNALSDSIREVGNEQLLDELQFRYGDEKKERLRLQEQKRYELQLKQQEIDMANFRQNIFLVVGILMLLIMTLAIFYFRLKQKSDELFSFTIVNKLEEERAKIARDLHDGLGQSMILLKNKFSKMKTDDQHMANQLNDNISEVIEEIRGISRSLIPPELKRLGLVKAIHNMLNEVENSTSIMVTTDIDDLDKFDLEQHQNIRLYRIIQELTTNTLKHSGATSLKLEAHLVGEGEAEITYQDNGSGLDLDKWRSASNSIGFKSIEQRLKYLRGTIKIERPKKGFKVIINIKQK